MPSAETALKCSVVDLHAFYTSTCVTIKNGVHNNDDVCVYVSLLITPSGILRNNQTCDPVLALILLIKLRY